MIETNVTADYVTTDYVTLRATDQMGLLLKPYQEISLAHICTYWLLCGMFTLLDCTQVGQRNRIISRRPLKSQLIKTCANSILNQIVTVTLLYLLYSPVDELLPEFTVMSGLWWLSMLPAWIFLADLYFYITHRIAHWVRPIYRHIHYIHHMGNDNTVATATLDAHVLEHVICNLGAALVGPYTLSYFYLPPHPILVLWTVFVTTNGVTGHAGYRQSTQHVLHHIYGACNFGSFPYIIDRMMGSYKHD